MAEPFNYLDRLAERARQDRAPQGDVSRRVMLRLNEQENNVGLPRLVFATGYAAVASAALLYAYILFGNMTDPLLSLFHQAAVIMP